MKLLNRIREAVEKAAEAIKERAEEFIERAKNRFIREVEEEEPLYKEEIPDYVNEEDLFTYEDEQSLADKLKDEDLRMREEAHQKAYEKFSDKWYDGDLSRETYDNMWNTIGEFTNDYGEVYGSPELILLYEEMEKKFGDAVNDKEFFKDFFENAANSIDVVYPEDVFDKLYDMIEEFESKEEFYDSIQSVFS